MVKLLVLLFVIMVALGFAMPPDYVAVGVLMFLLGYNAQYVLALAWRAHRARRKAPRRGSLVYLRCPHGPQAVRTERPPFRSIPDLREVPND